jgi:uncharacterized protein
MSFEIVHRPEARRWEILVDGEVAGHTRYQRSRGRIAFMHTEVDPEHMGEGLGSRLIGGVLDQLRSEGAEVLPFCPFVKSWIESHPDYLDLVPVEERPRFDL